MVRSGLCPERAGKFSCPVCNQYINEILGSSAFQRGAVHAVQTAFRPRANSLCAACRFWGRKLPFGVEFYPGTNRGTRTSRPLVTLVRTHFYPALIARHRPPHHRHNKLQLRLAYAQAHRGRSARLQALLAWLMLTTASGGH